MKKLYLLSFLLVITLFFTGCKNENVQNNNSETSNISRTSYEKNLNPNNNIASNTSENNTTNEVSNTQNELPKEEEISQYSTKIYTKESGRQTNMELTSSKLNGYVINSGETFSFCSVVGKATPDAGYQEADIFDSEGNVKKGYGGGNCQVSSTLYNAVNSISGIKITERHEHSRDVVYVPKGKDASVAYGSQDFKFINNNSFAIKLYVDATSDSINVKVVKLI